MAASAQPGKMRRFNPPKLLNPDMTNLRIKLSLLLNYFVFAILLNSVGTVILQVQNGYGIAPGEASILEAFKDLSIAVTSFLVASAIVRIGYKRAMLLALGFIAGVCLLMPLLPGFWMTKLLFAAVGVSFALIKVSVFATIGLITSDQNDHASFMNFLESFFMIGVLTGYVIFSLFVDDQNPTSTAWLNVYYLLAGIAGTAFVLLLTTPLDESAVQTVGSRSLSADFAAMLGLIAQPAVLLFIGSAFTFVLLEQGIMSWLPTFNSRMLHLSTSLSIQAAGILPATIALGRFLAGVGLRRLAWYGLMVGCLVGAGALVLVALPLASSVGAGPVTRWADAPAATFVFPLIGLLLAPIYPTINSLILKKLPTPQHGPMAGLIVVFSALGGTTGSLVTGRVFEMYNGQTAFYFSLIPLGLLLVLLTVFRSFLRTPALSPDSIRS
jgi:MFS transporter, FHS family, glucose/mannose:H+ symporter